MTYQRKSWQEKLADSKDLLRICDATKFKRGGTGTFVIPARTVSILTRGLAMRRERDLAWPSGKKSLAVDRRETLGILDHFDAVTRKQKYVRLPARILLLRESYGKRVQSILL